MSLERRSLHLTIAPILLGEQLVPNIMCMLANAPSRLHVCIV